MTKTAAAVADAPPATPAPIEGRFALIKVTDLFESPFNPRKTFDADKLEDLIASVREKGVLENLVVRPSGNMFEIVAGARRFRAASDVDAIEKLPCMVHDYTDVQVMEVMAIENDQREDVHPLEQALSYQQLLKSDAGYTPQVLAGRVGRDASTVNRRLKLLRLIPAAQKAFLQGEIELGHAEAISRLKEDDQAKALKACHDEVMDYDSDDRGARVTRLVTVDKLTDWVKGNIRLPLDAKAAVTEEFPELRAALAEVAAGTAPKLVEIHEGWNHDKKKPNQPLDREQWTPVKGKKDQCEFAARGCIVVGRHQGKILDICVGVGQCKAHWGHTIPKDKTPAGSASAGTRTKRSKAEIEAEKKAKAAREQRRIDEVRWNQVVDRAVAQLKKANIKPDQHVLAVLQELSLFSAKSWALLVAEVVKNDCFVRSAADLKKQAKLLKPLGVDLLAIDKELAAAEASADAKPAKKAGKGKGAK